MNPLSKKILYVCCASLFSENTMALQTEQWAVLNFLNNTHQNKQDYGHYFSSRFSVEISKIRRFSALSQDVIERALLDTKVRQPISDKFHIIRLGNTLGISSIVTGEISTIEVPDKPKPGDLAKVSLEIKIYDTVSGEVVNGANITTVSSPADRLSTPDSLIKEALEQAAFQGVREISARELLSAYVQNVSRCEAIISLGTSSGYRKDLKLVVTRGGQFVAFAKVKSVDTDQSQIYLTQGIGPGDRKGLSPGDRVRPIIDFSRSLGCDVCD